MNLVRSSQLVVRGDRVVDNPQPCIDAELGQLEVNGLRSPLTVLLRADYYFVPLAHELCRKALVFAAPYDVVSYVVAPFVLAG